MKGFRLPPCWHPPVGNGVGPFATIAQAIDADIERWLLLSVVPRGRRPWVPTPEEKLARQRWSHLLPFGGQALPPVNVPKGAWRPEAALRAEVGNIVKLLHDVDVSRVLLGCDLAGAVTRRNSQVSGTLNRPALTWLSEQLVPPLAANLEHADEYVIIRSASELAQLDERALPALERALGRSQSEQVRQALHSALALLRAAIELANHPCRNVSPKTALSWPLRELCDPIGHYPPVLFRLADGSAVYAERGGKCFRGRMKEHCYLKCLPGSAQIDTPKGPVPIERLSPDAEIWTVGSSGQRMSARLRALRATTVPEGHTLVRAALADGRVISASWAHPIVDGRHLGEVRVGESLDGSAVVEVVTVPYDGRQIFDLMPDGPTGIYFVDAVPVRSSLAE